MKKLINSLLFLIYLWPAWGQGVSQDIRLNQIGYLPAAQKYAVIVGSSETTFEVRLANSFQVVYQGNLMDEETWNASGEDVRIADFTEFDAIGDFQIYVADLGTSHSFQIQNETFTNLAKGTIKALYFNRASTELQSEHAGEFARPLGHPDNNVIVLPSAASVERPAGTVLSTPYGWYDAGDYNKYIVNSGISTFTFLSAYETFPELYDTLSLNIPESNNDIPDILDEAYWNLIWMVTMQDPNDGGVYNKTTTANFSGAVMPHRANAQRYVVAKGTAATLDFAGVMAMASRIFEPYMPEFAADCLEQAELAWQWAQSNRNVAFNNPSAEDGYPGVSTGGYGDGNFSDEFLWAGAELYITTGDDTYYPGSGLNRNYGTPGWPNVETLALLSLTLHRESLTAAANETLITDELLDLADNLLNGSTNQPYRIPNTGFFWGSNSGFANAGMVLIQAYELTKNKDYYDLAISCLDYLVGRNATTYSFVTGFGDKPPLYIHHRQSEADDIADPVPGFLAGGPNPNNQDQDCGAALYPSTLGPKSYLDDWCSYSTNEVTINWNAPIAFLSGGLQHIYLRDFQRDSEYEVTPLNINEGHGHQFQVYPNPTQDQIWIETATQNQGAQISLYSLSGQLVYNDILDTSRSISLSHLERGVYVMNYVSFSENFTERVVLN